MSSADGDHGDHDEGDGRQHDHGDEKPGRPLRPVSAEHADDAALGQLGAQMAAIQAKREALRQQLQRAELEAPQTENVTEPIA